MDRPRRWWRADVPQHVRDVTVPFCDKLVSRVASRGLSGDIKDPNGNITWTVPEGGGGPTYPNM
ncbi:4Fe-4S dicluster domain-containing protein [uncultured Cohaesibacter sp.]|uniref:4Fe-4S dicluster domain-containing protein n=1 Tax=uncultured Cohaesibacter sp. TaxID=1002546 RepID=UPI0037482DD1